MKGYLEVVDDEGLRTFQKMDEVVKIEEIEKDKETCIHFIENEELDEITSYESYDAVKKKLETSISSAVQS